MVESTLDIAMATSSTPDPFMEFHFFRRRDLGILHWLLPAYFNLLLLLGSCC